MSKKRVVLLSTLLAVALAGCGGDKNVVKLGKPEACVFPDAPKHTAPAWVCDTPVEGLAVSAVGAHEKSAAGPAFMKDQAVASARVNLAQQMRVHVANMVKQYAETTGAASSFATSSSSPSSSSPLPPTPRRRISLTDAPPAARWLSSLSANSTHCCLCTDENESSHAASMRTDRSAG